MSQVAAQAQIKAIQLAQQKATQSKVSAIKFLKDAGILASNKSGNKEKRVSKKQK